MARRFYDLPSLTTLAVFEAAARHLSLKEAAQELAVTPGAVTRQIKALEAELGTDLFRRIHRGVELTDEGQELLTTLSHSFGQTSHTIRKIRHQRAPSGVTIAATTAMATMWLMPQINTFWQSFPNITINHIISDNPSDFLKPGIDLRIRYGPGNWSGETSMLMFRDTIFPVAGPDFKPDKVTLEELPHLPLLLLEDDLNHWPSWNDWFRNAGLSEHKVTGRRFNNYVIAIQAAQDNQGIALGWRQMINPLLKQGRLKQVTDIEIQVENGYYLSWKNDQDLSEEAQILKDWLIKTTSVD